MEPLEQRIKRLRGREDSPSRPSPTRWIGWAALLARDYWEFYVIPMRAASLKAEGKSPAQIAKELGITKRRAERALELSLTLDDGINSPHLVPLILKHAPDIRR